MLGNWFSFDRPGGRLLTATFGAIFLLLGLANLTTVSVGSLVAAIPLEIVFIGGGGWLILSALSGVRVVQGVSVGGGAMLLRVALEAGESVLTYGVAGYEQVDKSQRKVPASARLTGECFVTDRRVIITPQRMMSIMGWRALDIRRGDVVKATPITRWRTMGLMRRAVELRLHHGATLTLWPRSEELRATLLKLG